MILEDKCQEYLDQLITHRNKRAINFLGTIQKFITGVPDRDETTMVQDKLNDLIENNNKLAIINTKMQKNLDYITGSNEYHVETLFTWLIKELEQIIQTINLAKIGILNTAILNLDEIHQILKVEKQFDAPLMEILEHATFKIIQIDKIYVLLMKYPEIKQKCTLFQIRPVGVEEGILLLERYTTNCMGKYNTVKKNCKKYINTNICDYNKHTCTEDLLNGLRANCTKIREHIPAIEKIDDGKILIHGNHKVNNITKKGTYLIMFNKSITIDNSSFDNDKELISQFIQRNKPSTYEILNVIESENAKLRIPRMTIMSRIPIEIENNPISNGIVMGVIFIVFIIILHYCIKICKEYNMYKITKGSK